MLNVTNVCLHCCIFAALYFIVICGLTGCTIVFHIIPLMARFLGKNVIEHIMYVLIFTTTFAETFLILRIIQRDIINVHMSSHIVSVILVRFQ